MFQISFKGLSKKFEGCYISRKFQGYFKIVSSGFNSFETLLKHQIFQENYKGFHGNFKGVLRVIQRYFKEEKNMIMAEVVKISTEIMFENHLYTFGGKVVRQKRGGPIGLRGACAIARLMCH